MATVTLTDFLLARIAEDKAVAIATRDSHDPLDWSDPGDGVGSSWGMDGPVDGPSGYTSIVIDPARVLAECEAKRRIVEMGPARCPYGEPDEDDGTPPDHPHYPDPGWMARYSWPVCEECLSRQAEDSTWRLAVSALAMPYADHPDYDEAWRL